MAGLPGVVPATATTIITASCSGRRAGEDGAREGVLRPCGGEGGGGGGDGGRAPAVLGVQTVWVGRDAREGRFAEGGRGGGGLGGRPDGVWGRCGWPT